MSDISRRSALRNIAATAIAGGLTQADAQHVHQAAAAAAAQTAYKPRVFSEPEWAALKTLCDLVFPGAVDGGAPEFIDLLASHNVELAATFTGGLAWLDRKSPGGSFTGASAAQRTALLDSIAYRAKSAPETAAGIRFFEFARRMIADAYYTSKPGIEELGFKGNQGQPTFQVPVEVLNQALKRSGL